MGGSFVGRVHNNFVHLRGKRRCSFEKESQSEEGFRDAFFCSVGENASGN